MKESCLLFFCNFLLLYNIILRFILICVTIIHLHCRLLLLTYLDFFLPSCYVLSICPIFSVSSLPSIFIFFLVEIFSFLFLAYYSSLFSLLVYKLIMQSILLAITLVIFNHNNLNHFNYSHPLSQLIFFCFAILLFYLMPSKKLGNYYSCFIHSTFVQIYPHVYIFAYHSFLHLKPSN